MLSDRERFLDSLAGPDTDPERVAQQIRTYDCRICKGTGIDPMSDNSSPLPCTACYRKRTERGA